MLTRVLLAVATTAFASPAHAGKLWIVSDRACPLVHFSEIQPAVDAAADGDVILVRGRTSGEYDRVQIDGKSLAIVADPRTGISTGPITIRNLAANQWVVLQGYEENPDADTRSNALRVFDCDGSVSVENWRFDTASSWITNAARASPGAIAVEVAPSTSWSTRSGFALSRFQW